MSEDRIQARDRLSSPPISGEIDTAGHILRHTTVAPLQHAISERLDGVGALIVSTNPGHSVKPASVSSHVFGYRCRGARSRRADKPSRSAGALGRPGMCLFLAANEESAWECEGPHEMLGVFCGVHFLADLATEAFGVDGNAIQINDGAFQWDETGARLGRLVEQRLRSNEHISSLELDAWAQIIGLHVLRTYSSLSKRYEHAGTSKLSARQIQAVIEFIQSNIESPLRLHDIAGSINMPQYTFARAFRNTMGTTPHQFLTALRIERAQKLLESGSLPLSLVANAVGFFDQSHFTVQFRRAVGMTPARYRNEHRG